MRRIEKVSMLGYNLIETGVIFYVYTSNSV